MTMPRICSIPRTVAGLVVAAVLTIPAATAPAVADAAPFAPFVPHATAAAAGTVCWFGACYDYVTGRQNTDTAGMSVDMLIANPVVNPSRTDEHSLQEIALQNSGQTSTVEIGWIVDRGLNGDALPHLFVYHWVNGQESCYNGCGFVPVSTTSTAGMALTAGTVGHFSLQNYQGNWWASYNGTWIGYFPGSLWGGSYQRAQVVSAFGEVAMDAADVPSCTQMGNGVRGDTPSSSWITNYRLIGSASTPTLSISTTSPNTYDAGGTTATSFRLGGQGTNNCR